MLTAYKANQSVKIDWFMHNLPITKLRSCWTSSFKIPFDEGFLFGLCSKIIRCCSYWKYRLPTAVSSTEYIYICWLTKYNNLRAKLLLSSVITCFLVSCIGHNRHLLVVVDVIYFIFFDVNLHKDQIRTILTLFLLFHR